MHIHIHSYPLIVMLYFGVSFCLLSLCFNTPIKCFYAIEFSVFCAGISHKNMQPINPSTQPKSTKLNEKSSHLFGSAILLPPNTRNDDVSFRASLCELIWISNQHFIMQMVFICAVDCTQLAISRTRSRFAQYQVCKCPSHAKSAHFHHHFSAVPFSKNCGSGVNDINTFDSTTTRKRKRSSICLSFATAKQLLKSG